MHGGLKTKEGRLFALLILIIVIFLGSLFFKNFIDNKNYKEQAVMADKYLNDGNYEGAIQAYLKALSMKNSNQEELSIGLSEAYIGINEYDKALEILRDCYKNTSGQKVKEKIEEVTARKTDYEYNQIISRAEIYFNNQEYDKAIAEYQKAKLIKSKEITSYQRIAEAYIEKGEYKSAEEEVLDGIALTQSEEFDGLMERIKSYLLTEQYKQILLEAQEYVYQENYDEAIKKYKEAIKLLPENELAYSGLSEIYLQQKRYQEAYALLQEALKKNNSTILKDLFEKVSIYKEEEDKKENMLSSLNKALKELKLDQVIKILNQELFQEVIEENAPIYFGINGEGDTGDGKGLIIYDKNNIYSGEFQNGIRKGYGIFFRLSMSNGKQVPYYYEGEWDMDNPNGFGKTEEIIIRENKEDKLIFHKTITEGYYSNGAENGSMRKYFYQDGKLQGYVDYTSQKGIPLAYINEDGETIPLSDENQYVIGRIMMNEEATGEYYSINKKTLWGVKTFIK